MCHSLPLGGSETRKNHVGNHRSCRSHRVGAVTTNNLYWDLSIVPTSKHLENGRSFALLLPRNIENDCDVIFGETSEEGSHLWSGVMLYVWCSSFAQMPGRTHQIRFNKGPNSTLVHRSKQSDPEGSFKFYTILLHQHLI